MRKGGAGLIALAANFVAGVFNLVLFIWYPWPSPVMHWLHFSMAVVNFFVAVSCARRLKRWTKI
jgi:hypothetical protein